MDLSTREGRREQGERIKRATKEAGLSLEELAARIGCSRALIYQYVSGAALAQTDRLQLIARELGKPLTWFFADEVSQGREAEQPLGLPNPSPGQANVVEERRIRERIAHLRALVQAYAGPADWRSVADTCQQLIPLLEHEEAQEEMGQVLLIQGNALIQVQELGSAKEKLEEAGALFRESGQAERAFSCQQSLGHINVMLGRTDEALHQFQQVAAGQEWTHRWQGTLSLGAAHEVLGNYTQAAELFVRALEIVDECSDPAQCDPATLYIDANWANLELDWGDYADAATRADRCILLAQRLGIQDQYIEALLTRSQALTGLQEYQLALTENQRALNVAQLTRDYQRWSLALSCRALCRTACLRTSDAVADGKEALAIALRCGASRAEMLAQRALAEAYLAANNTAEVRYHVAQAAAIAASLRLRQPQAQFAVLQARLDLGEDRPTEAATAARGALAIAAELEAKPIRLECHLILARIALATDDYPEAIRQAAQAEALTSIMHIPAFAWRTQAVIAQAEAANGNTQAARTTFMKALQLFQINRQRCFNASGVDALLEDAEAQNLWQQWLLFLESAGQSEDARVQAQEVDWPPLQNWFEEILEKQRRTNDA